MLLPLNSDFLHHVLNLSKIRQFAAEILLVIIFTLGALSPVLRMGNAAVGDMTGP